MLSPTDYIASAGSAGTRKFAADVGVLQYVLSAEHADPAQSDTEEFRTPLSTIPVSVPCAHDDDNGVAMVV